MRSARRRFLITLAILVGLGLSSCSDGAGRPASPSSDPATGTTPIPSGTASQPEPPTSPNLLVIEADDMRADELRWMPRTQALIGERGLVFNNSFTPNPLCCPSRASFLTGQYSHNHHVLTHEEPYGFGAFDDTDTLATRLSAAGIGTGIIGKYLNGYGVQPTFGGENSEVYVAPGWTEWWVGNDLVRPRDDPHFGTTYSYFDLTSTVNGELRSWPGRYQTDVTGQQTRAVVERLGADGRPWFVWWTPIAPHHGGPTEPDDPGVVTRSDGVDIAWDTPARPDRVKGRFDDVIVRGAGVTAFGSAEADRRDKPRYLRKLPELTPAERRALLTVTRQRAEALWVLDVQIARTLRELRQQGHTDDTIVVFTSDNGYYLGEHLKRQGKINLHEPSVRVPLLMTGPGIPVGERYDPVSTLDLSRTLAAWGGVELAAPDGLDLRDLITGGDSGWSRPIVIEGLMPEPGPSRAAGRPGWGRALNTVGLRLGRWKLVRYSTGETELYDLQQDPLELRSLTEVDVPRATWVALIDAWDQYVDCAGPECLAPLAPALRTDPATNVEITQAQSASESAYFAR
ncbi:MAG: sulfatase-like hydrolase/transferase [Nocardioides sp.]